MRVIFRKIMDITRYETVDYYKDIKIIDIDKASEPPQNLSGGEHPKT
jgi:hypothetical protein